MAMTPPTARFLLSDRAHDFLKRLTRLDELELARALDASAAKTYARLDEPDVWFGDDRTAKVTMPLHRHFAYDLLLDQMPKQWRGRSNKKDDEDEDEDEEGMAFFVDLDPMIGISAWKLVNDGWSAKRIAMVFADEASARAAQEFFNSIGLSLDDVDVRWGSLMDPAFLSSALTEPPYTVPAPPTGSELTKLISRCTAVHIGALFQGLKEVDQVDLARRVALLLKLEGRTQEGPAVILGRQECVGAGGPFGGMATAFAWKALWNWHVFGPVQQLPDDYQSPPSWRPSFLPSPRSTTTPSSSPDRYFFCLASATSAASASAAAEMQQRERERERQQSADSRAGSTPTSTVATTTAEAYGEDSAIAPRVHAPGFRVDVKLDFDGPEPQPSSRSRPQPRRSGFVAGRGASTPATDGEEENNNNTLPPVMWWCVSVWKE